MAQELAIRLSLPNFCKMDVGPTLGREHLGPDLPSPNPESLTRDDLSQSVREIGKNDLLEDFEPDVHSAEFNILDILVPLDG